METGIDEIDLQVGLSGDILDEHAVDQEVQYAGTSQAYRVAHLLLFATLVCEQLM